MTERIRERARFSKSSGMATWCRDQMANRYDQAIYINPDLNNTEPKINEVLDDGDYEIFHCDLPLEREDYATDAYNTLSDASVWYYAEDLGIDEEGNAIPSWVEHHRCYHDEIPNKPCEIVSRKTT